MAKFHYIYVCCLHYAPCYSDHSVGRSAGKTPYNEPSGDVYKIYKLICNTRLRFPQNFAVSNGMVAFVSALLFTNPKKRLGNDLGFAGFLLSTPEWRIPLLDHASLHSHNHTLTHSYTLLITCTCCYDQTKGTQDKDFSYSFSDSLSAPVTQ